MTNDRNSELDSGTAISERVARLAIAAERYLLPWIYVWITWVQVDFVHSSYRKYQSRLYVEMASVSVPLFWASMTKFILIGVFSAFMGITLLLSRRPSHLPKSLAQITVPLAMSYYLLLYTAVNRLPLELRQDLMPLEWRVPAAIIATSLSIVGYAVSFWGLLSLGRSFGILVAVRRIVNIGPYAYVRHPMYLGYILDLAGLMLSSFSIGMLMLGAGFCLLTVIRARLEEDRLVEADPAYSAYMKQTGFLFPRFKGARISSFNPPG